MISINHSKLIGSYSNPVNMEASMTQSSAFLPVDHTSGIIDDFVSKSTRGKSTILNSLYKDMYIYDSVCGPTVDLMATLPFSDFNLIGVKDPKISQIYEECLAELDPILLLQLLVSTYLVMGKVVGSLLFNSNRGLFTDVILHDIDMCEFTPIPLTNHDPKIDLTINPEFRKFLQSSDPRDIEAKTEIPNELMLQILKGGKIPLEPISTIYLERPTIPGVDALSYYNRVIPIWLIEKAIMRGTIIGASRRQRSLLHITAGNEEWEPSPGQLGEIAQLFMSADRDPQGAVAVTRSGVEANEIRNGSDFWKIQDDTDIFTTVKLRCMGIGEDFLSGSANYATTEVALSVFIEGLRSLRSYLTKKIFYDNIFLSLSKYHKFRKRTQAELNHNVRTDNHARLIGSGYTLSSKYIIPEIAWTKQLAPSSDETVTTMLETAKEAGIPIPVRVMASACGLSIDKIMEQFDEDIELRKGFADYKKRLKEALPKSEEGDEEEGGGDMWSAVQELPDEVTMTPQAAGEVIDINKEKLSSRL